MKILLATLILTLSALAIDRPYLHIAVFSDFCDKNGCVKQEPFYYDVHTFGEAMMKFYADHPNSEIKCMARDYYALCEWRF